MREGTLDATWQLDGYSRVGHPPRAHSRALLQEGPLDRVDRYRLDHRGCYRRFDGHSHRHFF